VFVPVRLFGLVYFFAYKLGAYLKVECLKDPPLREALALHAIIRLGWKCSEGTNTLAYYKHS
jgi:hypothetical protein